MDNLTISDFELIRIDSNTTLFFHAPSLQIHEIDKELASILEVLKNNGFDKAAGIIGAEDLKEARDFITEHIRSSPNSVTIQQNETAAYRSIVLPIAASCNLACPYCFAQTGNGFNFKNYTNEDIEDVIDFLVKNNVEQKEVHIVFFGGEPLLNFAVMRHVVDYARNNYPEYTFGYSITTNGTILNDDIINFLKVNNVAVLLSIDGPDNEYNLRFFKNGNKSLDVVRKNITRLVENDIYLELRATLVSSNPNIFETYTFFEDLKVPYNIVFAYPSINKTDIELSSYSFDKLSYIEKEFQKVISFYENKLNLEEQVYLKSFNEIKESIQYRVIKDRACGGGLSYHTIMANGDIYSCPHLMNDKEYRVGNIKYDPVIQNTKYTFPSINQLIKCKDCWARHLCAGGCPSEKIIMGRSVNDNLGYEACELERIKYKFLIKLYYLRNKFTS